MKHTSGKIKNRIGKQHNIIPNLILPCHQSTSLRSHMRSACALLISVPCVSLAVSRREYFQALNLHEFPQSQGFSTFYIPGEEGKPKFDSLTDFASTARAIPSQNV